MDAENFAMQGLAKLRFSHMLYGFVMDSFANLSLQANKFTSWHDDAAITKQSGKTWSNTALQRHVQTAGGGFPLGTGAFWCLSGFQCRLRKDIGMYGGYF